MGYSDDGGDAGRRGGEVGDGADGGGGWRGTELEAGVGDERRGQATVESSRGEE